MDTLDFLSVVAAVVFTLICGYEIWLIVHRKIFPNPTSKLLFAGTTVLNGVSYFLICRDFARSLLPLSAIVAIFALFYATYRQQKRFMAPIPVDYFVLVASIVVAMCWLVVRIFDASAANIIMQVIIAGGYIPLISSMIRGKTRESWVAWLPIAISIQLYIAFEKFDGSLTPLLFPLRGFISGLLVSILALIYPNKHLIRAGD